MTIASHRTDTANAALFVEHHGQDIQYSHLRKKWFVWDGKRWVTDNTGEIFRKAKVTVQRLLTLASEEKDTAKQAESTRHALQLQSEHSLNAMVSLARHIVPIEIDKLDSDPWLLNVSNGTLDLKLGLLREHRREDLISQIAPVDYDPEARCPTWDNFLHTITNGDKSLKKYLQKVAGYALTGDTSEQCMFVLYGSGANGKTTFVTTLSTLLNDYSKRVPTETLLVRRGESIPNDLARLKGARFVSADEAESGRRLAETLVKQLTGGDRITARFLHSEYFEFTPTFKMFLATNHKPDIRETTEAMWRRVRLIPFTVTIPDEKQDKHLTTKLKAELQGILRWAVEGTLQWQRERGLKTPDPVKSATASYRSEMDTVAQFIEQCCETHPDVKTPIIELYQCYEKWSSENQETPLTKREFGLRLGEKGFPPAKGPHGVAVRVGIRLRENSG